MARVGLVRAILKQTSAQSAPNLPYVATAVNGLRESGQTDELPQALLTASLYHFVRGDTVAAHAALNEAEQIAQRGPMPLHLADVHLHRARMFRDKAELAKARALIEKHGYWRRKEELEDAEEAAKKWPA